MTHDMKRNIRYILSLLFLLMCLGVGEAWGQTTDYSGVYYLSNQASTTYYLVPTINCFYDDDEDKPHLTTYPTKKDKNSIWRIERVAVGTETYYRIIHNATGKYLMANEAVSGLDNSNKHRKRVHLETLASLEGLDASTDKSLFTIVFVKDDKIVAIKSKNVGSNTNGDGDTHWYLNPQGGNKETYRADGDRKVTVTAGIIGFYGKDSDNTTKPSNQTGSQWKLETAPPTCATPVIQYADKNTIKISYPISSDTGWTIYYTTDGTDPSDATNEKRTSISATATLTDLTKVSKVRAIATKTDWESSEEAVLITSGVGQIIQNKECEAFYMVAPFAEGETNATTTNIPSAAISWTFQPAGLYCGIQYYNILDKDGKYLYCSNVGGDDNALVMKETSEITTDEQKDCAKFRLLLQDDGSFKLISKWWAAEKPNNFIVTKKGGNDNTANINLSAGTDGKACWNIIAPDDIKSLSIVDKASTETDVTYIKIQSANATGYYVVPPTLSGGNATASNTSVIVNATNSNWYLLPATDGEADEWVTYYNIRNGLTGEYLYFEGSAGADNTFFTSNEKTGDVERYKFIIVKGANTTYADAYNIIPKELKGQANQANNSLNRNNTTLKTQNSRNTAASLWNLVDGDYTVAPPYITYDVTTNKVSVSCTTPGAVISYATNLSDEQSSINVPYSSEEVLTEGITTITATATKSETSNQTTYNVLIQTTVDDDHKRPYLIQSQNNKWTTGEHQGFHYYMVPGETVEGNMYANTTTVFKPSMQWYFKYAEKADDGTVYYYIVNNDNGRYMYFYNVAATGYTSGSIYLKESSEFSSSLDNYKFFIRKQSNGYNIVPKLVAPSDSKLTNVHKGDNNNSNKAITLNNNATAGNSLWKFILKSDLDQEAPFSASTENATSYYKIHNGVASNYYITPPATTGGKVVMSNSSDETVQKSMNWYLEKIDDATNTDWLAYYVIRNAVTGDYLYYNYDDSSTPVTPVTTGSDECFEMRSDYEASKKEHYLFTWARSHKDDRYYIVPQILKDYSLNDISSLRRNNTKLNIDVTRNSEAAIWQFKVSDLFCNIPVFEEADGKITLSCNTNASEIRYTTNGDDPTSVDYSTYSPSQPFSSSDKMVIKACAVVSDGTNTATSDIVTLLNKPDITLAGETYTYKGAAWEPAVTKVSINETEAPTSPATYSVSYSNNINAGTATITLTDADPNDSWYIWNGATPFTIAQKELTITADNDTKEYDGTPLTKNSYTSSELAEGDSFKSVKITGSQTDVGSSDNVPSNAVIKNASDEIMTSNYNITYGKGTLKVTKKSIGDGNDPASDIDVSIGAENAIILTYGDMTLTKGNDYTINEATISASGRYSSRTVTANEEGNYTGSFKARNAIVNFQTDDNGVEWSATFVAEPADPDAAPDETKGHVLPAGIMACIIKDIDTEGGRAIAEALDYIPEGIPVLLLSNVASGGFFVKDASGQTAISDDQKSNNKLEVTSENQYFDVRTIYLLYQNEFVYNMAGLLAKGKVYLNPNHGIGGSRPAPSRLKIRINTETGTGIDNVTEEAISDTEKDSWFTLDGRRLNGKPQRRGLYITREKKVIVR